MSKSLNALAPASVKESLGKLCSELFNIRKAEYKHFTSITLKLNTNPNLKNGYTSAENYGLILQQIVDTVVARQKYAFLIDSTFELDSKCQLHCHATLNSKYAVYRKGVINNLKVSTYGIENITKYQVFLKPLDTLDDITFWTYYLRKNEHNGTHKEARELYHYLWNHKHGQKPQEFDKNELADYDIEVLAGRPYYKSADKAKILEPLFQ